MAERRSLKVMTESLLEAYRSLGFGRGYGRCGSAPSWCDLLDVKRVDSERRYSEPSGALERRGHELHLFARRWDEAAAPEHRVPRAPGPRRAAITPLLFALSASLVVRQ